MNSFKQTSFDEGNLTHEQKENNRKNEDRERKFRKLLEDSEMTIEDVEGDGNCLFRSCSKLLYGSED